MPTKFLTIPANLFLGLTNSSPRASTSSSGTTVRLYTYDIRCSILFRRSEIFPWDKSPQAINLLLFCHNQFLRDARPLLASLVRGGDDDKSPSCSSNDAAAAATNNHHLSCTVKEEDDEAREAVSEILQEFGASEAESIEIALRSPKFLAMLVDSVRELDELSELGSYTWSRRSTKSKYNSSDEEVGEEESPSLLSVKQKVYFVAKVKGDKGMLPFLESLGMSFPSAKHLARYLSSETLPNLIQKVKYVKEVFFSVSDDGGVIGKKARRMKKHLSISVSEDVQQTLSFFEKIEARRGGLDMLGSGDASFRYLIESFPRLLLLSKESHMKPTVEFLEDIGVSRGGMRNVLLLFPPSILYNIEAVKLRLHIFKKVGARNQELGRMLMKYPWILSAGIQENYEEIISFFEAEKVPKVSVDLAIKSWPLLLGCSVSKLKLMVELFDEFRMRNKKLGHVIATSPQLLLWKPQEFLQVVSFLEELGLDEETITRVLARCPEIFATSIEKTLQKKVDFLISIGVSKSHFPPVIRRYPDFFVCDVDRSLLPRMMYLMKSGLSRRDVASMVHRFSPLLGYSIEEVLRPKLEFLVNTMGKPLKDVVDYPRYFSYSLQKKIKPRYWVLQGRNVECSLKEMLRKNDDEFAVMVMRFSQMSATNDERSTQRVPRLITWAYPVSGKIKLNTDGCSRGNPGAAGFGGVFRNDQGTWIEGYYGKLHECCSLEAELWGIYKGLHYILAQGLTQVDVETDSLLAVQMIKEGTPAHSPLRSLVVDCAVLMERSGCNIAHTLREGNRVADRLANMGADSDEYHQVTISQSPAEILNLLEADKLGVAFIRP